MQKAGIMILTVGNTKGGVGKTTLALNLAIARAVDGKRVWLVDGDRQGTAKIAMTIRAQAGSQPSIPCDKYPDGEELHAQVKACSKQFDDVVIDAGGRDSSALRAALVLSDVILVPFAPRSLDVWALTDMCNLIDEARVVRTGLRAVAVLSMADNTGRDNEDAIEALKDFPQLDYLPTPILRRKAVANAAGQGLSVLELKPKDAKAIKELKALYDSVYISL
jgi:chromosome partitioning protein